MSGWAIRRHRVFDHFVGQRQQSNRRRPGGLRLLFPGVDATTPERLSCALPEFRVSATSNFRFLFHARCDP